MSRKKLFFNIGSFLLLFVSVSCASNDGQGIILSDDFKLNSSIGKTRRIETTKSKGGVGYVRYSGIPFLKLSGSTRVVYKKISWPADFRSGELAFDFRFDFDQLNDKRIDTTLRNQILTTIEVEDAGALKVYWIKEGYLVVLFTDKEGNTVASLKTQMAPSKNEINSFKLSWGNGVLLSVNDEVKAGIRHRKKWDGFQSGSNRQAALRIGAAEKSSVINCFSIGRLSLVRKEFEEKNDIEAISEIDISDIPQELKKYYIPQDKYLSYPDYPLEQGGVKSSSNVLQRMRLVHIEPHVLKTIEQARRGVKFLKSQGFNSLITEHSRYLLRDVESVDNKEHHVLRTEKFEELVRTNRLASQAAHENGMKYYQHLTYNMIDDKLAEQNPQWLVRSLITGKIIKNRYRTYTACQNNDDFFKLWSKRFERLMRESNSDGAMIDEIQLFSPYQCGCDSCMRKFKEDTGLELPKDRKNWILNTSDPVYKKWVVWRKNKILSRRQDVTEIVKKCNPDGIVLVYSANPMDIAIKMQYAGMRFDETSLYAQSIGQESEPPMSKGYGHLSHYYPHSIIYEMKYNQAVARKTGNGYFTLFYGTRAGSKEQPGWHIRAWLLSLTLGSRSWYLQYYPWVQRPHLAWEKKHEVLLPNLSPYTKISIPVSVSSQTWVAKEEGHPENLISFSSLCTAMQDSHIPHRLITEYDLDSGDFIQDTDLLLGMNLKALSNNAVDSIRRFVEQGGTVVLSGESSMFDEKGAKRKDFALAELIGAHYAGSANSSRLLFIGRTNEITGDFKGKLKTDYGFVRLKSIEPDVKISGHIIDSQGKRHAGILSRTYGKGKVVYFAGYPDARYFIGHGYRLNRIEVNKMWHDKRSKKYLNLLSRMIHQLQPNLTLQTENLPSKVFAEIHRQDTPEIKGYQVHLLNLLDTKLQSGFIDPPPALRFPSVKENLPDKTKPIKIKVKCSDVKGVFLITPDFDKIVRIPFEQSDGFTQIELPYFYRYAMLYFVQEGMDVISKLAKDDFVDFIPDCKSIGEYGQEYPPVGKYHPADAVFFADSDKFEGGYLDNRKWVWPTIRRYAVGKGGGQDTISFNFDLEKNAGPLTFEICAKNNNSSIKAPITLKLNGKEVSFWVNDFPYNQWAVKKMVFPANLLKTGNNKLEFENHGQGPLLRAPWFGINFIRILEPEEIK